MVNFVMVGFVFGNFSSTTKANVLKCKFSGSFFKLQFSKQMAHNILKVI